MKALTKSHLKFLQKLRYKKYRDIENLFIISGLRAVKTVLENKDAKFTECIFSENKNNLANEIFKNSIHSIPQFLLPLKEFAKLVNERSPQGVCLIARKPSTLFITQNISGKHFLFLDKINDPGNLGTIIRSAGWFGFSILLSPDSADPFQPKVVRASAGTLLNISIFENIGPKQLENLKNAQNFNICATDVRHGEDISHFEFEKKSIIMMGSEAHGLTPEIAGLSNAKISIRKNGKGESLNVGTAASIIMYQVTLNNKRI